MQYLGRREGKEGESRKRKEDLQKYSGFSSENDGATIPTKFRGKQIGLAPASVWIQAQDVGLLWDKSVSEARWNFREIFHESETRSYYAIWKEWCITHRRMYAKIILLMEWCTISTDVSNLIWLGNRSEQNKKINLVQLVAALASNDEETGCTNLN